MKITLTRIVALAALALVSTAACAADTRGEWQDEFPISSCKMQSTGRNPFFILEPGYQLVLEGGGTRVAITVLDKTRDIAGVTTRVVEEREWKKGKLHEVALNYLAVCEGSNDVYYFGEDVDIHGARNTVSHAGTWLAGSGKNKPGLMMPGTPKHGMKYYQEIAPGVAMDRAEIVSLTETCKTPAGTFPGCIKIRETSVLEPGVPEIKYYAPGVGFVGDGTLKLVRYGPAR